jgi:hypothetical protein
VLVSQCLARRIPDLDTLTAEVEAWVAARNTAGAAVKWMFGVEQARLKLGHAYPTYTVALPTWLPESVRSPATRY